MIFTFPLALLLIGGCFWWAQQRQRRGKAAYVDIGLAFMIVVLVYGFLPGLGLALASVGVGEVRDSRLSGGVDVDLVEEVETIYLALALAFACAYTWTRDYGDARHDHRHCSRSGARITVTVAVLMAVGILAAKVLLGVERSTDYIGSYAELRSLPLLYQQLFGIANQLAFAALIASIVYWIAWKPKSHSTVAAVLAVYLVYATFAGGSRTEAFLCFFSYMVAASVYVPGFSMRRVVALGVPALLLFMVAGYLRDPTSEGSYLGLLQGGEFMALFINAVDLQDRFNNGFASEVRFAFYFVDLIRLLPAQLLGGVKIDPATWYVETFYPDYYDAGGGLAFGVMAESVAGLGWIDALLRGALLGWFFGAAANRLINREGSPWHVFVYVWLVVLSYQCFRDTTFSIVTRAVYQLLPLILILRLFGATALGAPRQVIKP